MLETTFSSHNVDVTVIHWLVGTATSILGNSCGIKMWYIALLINGIQ
jgi:hypothetical protein